MPPSAKGFETVMKSLTRLLGWVFGLTMLALSVMVTIETLVRKLFSISLGGVDELSGYAVAIAGPLAITIALIESAHIRINIFYLRMSRPARRVLDVLSMIALTILSGFLSFFAYRTVMDTYQFKSLAQTPWATPMIYPQSLWLLALLIFTATTLILLAKSFVFLNRKDWEAMDQILAPESLEDELKAELEDLKVR
jgi:TRAP-type C4-dicarboxylate transport system permease small subunit